VSKGFVHGPGPTLIIVHVPRTGGTTVCKRLGAGILRARQIGPTYDTNYKEAAALWEGKVRVIASHFPYGAHEKLAGPYEYATILRHPVARAGSSFRWHSPDFRFRSYYDPALREAASKGIAEFVKQSIERNPATKLLAGLGMGHEGELGRQEFGQAVTNLAKIKFVGFTEDLDPWLKKLASYLGMGAGLGSRSHTTGGGSVEFEGAELKAIHDANNWDMLLYEHARKAYA
jgi:hypothetical protein